MKNLAKLFFATGILIICSFSSVYAQFLWTEDFSDNDLEGAGGNCGATAPTCNIYNAPSDSSISEYPKFELPQPAALYL